MTAHSSILAWEIPWTGAWQATVHGVAKEVDTTYQLNNNRMIWGSYFPSLCLICASSVNDNYHMALM